MSKASNFASSAVCPSTSATSECNNDSAWGKAPSPSLYEQLGGKVVVAALVDDLYERIMTDPVLASLFEDTSMRTLKQHQRRFLAYALGGAVVYTGRGLRQAHADVQLRYGIGDVHFDAVINHLRSALLIQEARPLLIEKVIAIAESTRNDVLGR